MTRVAFIWRLISHLQRVFTYANRWDTLAIGTGIVAAIGSGVTQPLMFTLFGELIRNKPPELPPVLTGRQGISLVNSMVSRLEMAVRMSEKPSKRSINCGRCS